MPYAPQSGPDPSASAPARTGRLLLLDATRGLAMCFVLLSHFASDAALPHPAGLSEELVSRLLAISMIASPAFMLVSGMTCSMLLESRNRDRTRRYLFDRALFTVLVGHTYFMLIDIASIGDWQQSIYMTDTIGIALLVGLLVVPRTSAHGRFLIGAAMFAGAWIVHLAFYPTEAWLVSMEEIIAGPLPKPGFEIAFPILPWTGVFLLGSAVGPWLARARREGALAGFARGTLVCGSLAIVLGLMVKAVFWVGRARGVIADDSMLVPLLASYTKYPPGPVYLLFYGGAALSFLGLIGLATSRRPAATIPRLLATFGRASLFTFLAQALIYRGLLRHTPVSFGLWWPVWFALSVVLLWTAARWWDRINGNRWLTLGLRGAQVESKLPGQKA